MDDLTKRVERLERNARRWRRAAVAGGVAAAVGLGLAAAGPVDVPNVVEARAFNLVGRDGTVRGSFSLRPDDLPLLKLSKGPRETDALFILTYGEDEPIMVLYGKDDVLPGGRAVLAVTDGKGRLTLSSPGGKPVEFSAPLDQGRPPE